MQKTYQLWNQVTIPSIGFGTWELPDGDVAYRSVAKALACGYRHIDTAQVYGNEESVGRAIKDSPLDRKDIFLTTKVWNDKGTYQEALESIEASMQRLQVDYLDLVLIHWPNPRAFQANDAWKERNAGVWQALEKGYQDGKIRAIGVSNFRIHHLKELFKTAQVKPMVNQIKLSPGLTQDELVAFCRQEDILVEAYSPLGRGKAFTNDSLKAMADKYQVTVAQLCLQFSVQNGFLPLPRSKTPKNIEANLQWPAFAIAPEDMAALKVLPDLAKASDPDQADF